MTNLSKKISIITVCKNAGKDIERTIQSVLDQTYENIEYIVVDGASEDETMDVINHYRDRIDIVVSEPDDGIYQAMNKGIELSHGDVLYFLNNGDYLASRKIIEGVMNIFVAESPDIIYGHVFAANEYGGDFSVAGCQHTDRYFFYKRSYPHQAVFYKKELFETHGCYPKEFRIIADCVLNSQLFTDTNTSLYYNETVVAVHLTGGIGSIDSAEKKKEKRKYRASFFSEEEQKIFRKRMEKEANYKRFSMRRFIGKIIKWVKN